MKGIKRLIEFGDKKAREEMGDYYIVSKGRMDNLTSVVAEGAKKIKELTEMVASQQEEIARLALILSEIEGEGDDDGDTKH